MGLERREVSAQDAGERSAAATSDAAGKGTLVQRYTQEGGAAPSDGASVQRAAAAGATGNAQLPHFDQIQKSFGAHDISGVKATVGGGAKGASEAIGAESYAQGDRVAFKESPNLWLAAHEAAHTVQQKNGAQVAGGVGAAGDSHEQNADRVADAVVAGKPAEHLLGAPGGTASPTSAVQRYVRETVGGGNAKVSNTGLSAVVPSQTLYAATSLVTASNNALKSVGKHGSHIRLVEDPKHSVTPKKSGTKINRVLPTWVSFGKDDGEQTSCSAANNGGPDSEGTKSKELAMYTDCGNSSGAVTGSTLHGDRQVVYNKDGKEKKSYGFDDKKQKNHDEPHSFSNQIYMDLLPGFMADPANEQYLFEGWHYTLVGGKKQIVTLTEAIQAKSAYHRLKQVGQEKFDKLAGINHFANPNVGESYTMASEMDSVGFKETSSMTWNFHWAGVVMKDGADNLTLENFAVTAETAKAAGIPSGKYVDRDWNFDMYGTVDAKGDVNEDQTFHKEHLDSNTHGSQATTMAVRTDK